MAETARVAGVKVVAGDTKGGGAGKRRQDLYQYGRDRLDTGGVHLSARKLRPGDRILVSGSIGDHGMAILSQREGLEFSTSLVSDCAPLNGLVQTIWIIIMGFG